MHELRQEECAMRRNGVEPDEHAVATLIAVAGSAGDLDMAATLHAGLRDTGAAVLQVRTLSPLPGSAAAGAHPAQVKANQRLSEGAVGSYLIVELLLKYRYGLYMMKEIWSNASTLPSAVLQRSIAALCICTSHLSSHVSLLVHEEPVRTQSHQQTLVRRRPTRRWCRRAWRTVIWTRPCAPLSLWAALGA